MNRAFAKKFLLTLITSLLLYSININIIAEEETHKIIYTVTNESDSADTIKGVSLPKENIEVPDFVELLNVTPNEPNDIGVGDSKDFTINFKIKDNVENTGSGIVKLKLKYDPDDQLITPVGEDTVEIFDGKEPKSKGSYIIPTSVKADEPQSVYVNLPKRAF